jgi:hypothetical protein
MIDEIMPANLRKMKKEYGSRTDLRYCPIPIETLSFWSKRLGVETKEINRKWEVLNLNNWCG